MIMKNKIYNEDCVQGIKRIPTGSIDAILTDPPYLYLKNQKLDKEFDEDALFKEWMRVLKDDGMIAVFGRGESFYRWGYKLTELGLKFKEEVVWNKQYSSSPVHRLSRVHETLSIWTKGNGIINKVKVPYLESKKHDIDAICGDIKRLSAILGNQKDLNKVLKYLESGNPYNDIDRDSESVTIAANSTKKVNVSCMVMQMFKDGMLEKSIISEPYDRYFRIHPTQKPVPLLVRILNLISKKGDTILDCFSGSGSTAVACMKSGREFIGFELDKEYYDKSIERIHSERDLFTF